MITGEVVGKAEDGFDMDFKFGLDGKIDVYYEGKHVKDFDKDFSISIEDGEVVLRWRKYGGLI